MKDAREFAGYKEALGRNNVILLAVVGSTMLGLSKRGESDLDEMGICLEQPRQLLGFAPFEHEIYRSAVERTGKFDAKSEPDDVDLTIYGLRKFVRMALSGNPNVMNLLYLRKEACRVYTPLAEGLQNLSGAFASKQVSKAFLGYMQAQRQRLEGTRGQRGVNRPELEEEHGYDTQYAMHLVRLGMQGYEFARTGKLRLPLSSDNIEFLQKIRNGRLSYQEVRDYATSYENRLKEHLDDNTANLRDKPDYETIEKWLLTVYEREWYGKGPVKPAIQDELDEIPF